ncbi:TonB-dependent receptor [Neolewinella aurantiaca]|uniref:TonB-dependent receptor n=1 Tax=Neolewinella aurantiaca TaxID=2602767 RepID=A0A5C7FM80_9BACT|nr:TonB-dependent receptor [Neolewinella aurantiaca]TXF91170.1 TonB-dependent receptor [Neolewinella aurantiaca]
MKNFPLRGPRGRTFLLFTLLLSFSLQPLFAGSTDFRVITGTVTSAEDGETLIGVSVIVQGSNSGTVTDLDGKYSLDVPDGATLIFSYTGMSSQTIPVGSQTVIDVQLMPDAELLDEIVVIGYGSQKKSHLTGAVSKVKNENLDQIAVSRVDDALIGQVSGVNIQSTSAEAGQAPTITIRGVGSINASSGPAVVVDGIVVDASFLGNLDMNSVESFEILKDAASAAIYGSEGSNGVILITTKSGKEGKTKFNYETFFGRKEAFGSDAYRKDLDSWAAQELAATGELSDETLYAQAIVDVTGVSRDWQDVFFDGGNITSHSLSARGGTAKTKFSTNLRYLDDQGVVLDDNYTLYSLNLKMSTELTNRLKLGLSLTPSHSKLRRLPTSIHNVLRQSPWLPIYHTQETIDQFVDQDIYPNLQPGDYFYENHLVRLDFDGDGSTARPRTTGDANAFAQHTERQHYEYKTNLLSSAYLQYKIADGLVAKTSFGVTIEQRKRTRYDGVLYHAAGTSRALYNLQNRFSTRLISDNTLDYNKSVGAHEFGALAGLTIQERQRENSDITGIGYTNDLLRNLQGATSISEFLEVDITRRKVGYFFRANYAYDNRYLLNATFRRDGSSVFGLDSKWGNFPAVSAGWNAHNESFLSGSNLVSLLKLRVSYGLTGNENFNVGDDIVNTYPYLALLNSSNAIVDGGIENGVSALNVANELLQWEGNEEFSVGVDFGLLENRVSGSIDYYKRTSDNLLLENPVSYVTGFSGGIVNLGEVQNRGFEGELRTVNIAKQNFKWSSTFIASTNKNELLNFGESNGALVEDNFGRNSQWINLVGQPISAFYGYVVDREVPLEYINTPFHPINSSPEDVIVKDLNGDGIITDADKTVLGDPYPELVWSITNEFKLGNFDLSIMIQGSQGAEVRNIGDQYFFNWFGQATQDPQQLVEDGLISDISFIQEKVLTNEVIQPAGYFSLRNVNLGYNFTSNQLSRFKIGGLRLYVSGQNLIYKTSDRYNGFNPEFIEDDNPRAYGSQRGGSPLFRTMSAGLNINF